MDLIDPRITILIDGDGAEIEIHDTPSSTTFATVKLTPQQLATALGRLGRTECSVEVQGLERVGKKMEIDTLCFEMTECDYKQRDSVACDLADRHCPKGWKHDGYFGSQGSFYQSDGKKMAKTTIRRWV